MAEIALGENARSAADMAESVPEKVVTERLGAANRVNGAVTVVDEEAVIMTVRTAHRETVKIGHRALVIRRTDRAVRAMAESRVDRSVWMMAREERQQRTKTRPTKTSKFD